MNGNDNDSVNEQIILENHFGKITTKRVTYKHSKGLFSGSSTETVPLQHITSVENGIIRSKLAILIVFVIAILLFNSNPNIIPSILFAIWGVVLVLGKPFVVVNTSGLDLNKIKGHHWQRSQAKEFADTLQKQMFSDNK